MATTQRPTQAQLVAHYEAELGRLERQIETTRAGEMLLKEAFALLVEGGEGCVRSALLKLVEYQLGPAQLALSEMEKNRIGMVELVRQAKSPLIGAALIPPTGGFGKSK